MGTWAVLVYQGHHCLGFSGYPTVDDLKVLDRPHGAHTQFISSHDDKNHLIRLGERFRNKAGLDHRLSHLLEHRPLLDSW